MLRPVGASECSSEAQVANRLIPFFRHSHIRLKATRLMTANVARITNVARTIRTQKTGIGAVGLKMR